MNIVTRRQTAAPALYSRPTASSDDALAHVPCFGMELLERRILYAATYAMSDLLIEPDGSAIVVGQTSNTTEIGLWRMNPDGTVDTGFGTNGAALSDIFDDAIAIARTDDGKYLVAGNTEANGSLVICLFRFNADGTIDTSWGDDGRVVQAPGAGDMGWGISIADDGKILVAGTGASDHTASFARFHADGRLDTSFGNGGTIVTQLRDEDFVQQMTYADDGSALVLSAGRENDYILRFNADGTLDTSFGTNGRVAVRADGGDMGGHTRGFALLADGGFVATGSALLDGRHAIAVSRFNADGSVDTSFGDNGVALIGHGSDHLVGRSLDVRYDGKIIVGGTRSPLDLAIGNHTDPRVDVAVAQLFPDGTLDTSFGDAGIQTTDMGHFDAAGEVRVAPDGTIILAGTSDQLSVFVARYAGGAPVPAGEPRPEPAPDPAPTDGSEQTSAAILARPDHLLSSTGDDDDDARGSAFSLLSTSSSDLLDGDADEDELRLMSL